MSGRKSKQKGKRGEREWAQVLTENGINSKRGVQYQGGPESPDVVSEDCIAHWEVKKAEALRIHDALDQAIDDCPSDKIPIVSYKKSRKDWICIMRGKDAIDLIKYASLANSL